MEIQWRRQWEQIPYETRLIATKYIMNQIVEHAITGGTYRYLIYDRLGFRKDAYSILFPEGLVISNEFNIEDDGQ